MYGYCKHQWRKRTDVMLAVLPDDERHADHEFYVCSRCLRIREITPGHDPNSNRDHHPFRNAA